MVLPDKMVAVCLSVSIETSKKICLIALRRNDFSFCMKGEIDHIKNWLLSVPAHVYICIFIFDIFSFQFHHVVMTSDDKFTFHIN